MYIKGILAQKLFCSKLWCFSYVKFIIICLFIWAFLFSCFRISNFLHAAMLFLLSLMGNCDIIAWLYVFNIALHKSRDTMYKNASNCLIHNPDEYVQFQREIIFCRLYIEISDSTTMSLIKITIKQTWQWPEDLK